MAVTRTETVSSLPMWMMLGQLSESFNNQITHGVDGPMTTSYLISLTLYGGEVWATFPEAVLTKGPVDFTSIRVGIFKPDSIKDVLVKLNRLMDECLKRSCEESVMHSSYDMFVSRLYAPGEVTRESVNLSFVLDELFGTRTSPDDLAYACYLFGVDKKSAPYTKWEGATHGCN